MNLKKIQIFFLLIFVFSCRYKESVGPDFFSESEIKELSKKVLVENDEIAYVNLRTYYFQKNEFQNILDYAKSMSTNKKSPQAAFDVFLAIQSRGLNNDFKNERQLKHLDSNKRNEALKYLLLAYERGHKQSVDYLEEYSFHELYIIKVNDVYTLKE